MLFVEEALGFRSLNGIDVGFSINITDERFPLIYNSMNQVKRLDNDIIWAIGAVKPNITTMISMDGGFQWQINNFPLDFYEFDVEGEGLIFYEGVGIYSTLSNIQPVNNQTAWLQTRSEVLPEKEGSQILRTEDGGATWDIVEMFFSPRYLSKFEAVNSSVAFRVVSMGTGSPPYLQVTRDAGESWETVHTSDGSSLDSFVVDREVIWILSGNGSSEYNCNILVSNNGGRTFTSTGNWSGGCGSVGEFVPVDQDIAWLEDSAQNEIHKTEDGGAIWKKVIDLKDLDGYDDYVDFDIVSANAQGLMLQPRNLNFTFETTDGGKTWTRFERQEPESIILSNLRNSNETIYALGQDGYFAASQDGGQTWIKAPIPSSVSGDCEYAFSSVRDLQIRNFETTLTPLDSNDVQINAFGRIGAVLEACWEAPLEPFCFDSYMVNLFERNMSKGLEDYGSRIPVKEFYVFPSPQIDDFGGLSRSVAPLVKNCIKSTVLRPGKTYLLSVEARKYTSRCFTGGCAQTSDGFGTVFYSENLKYESDFAVIQEYPEKRTCINEDPPPPQALRLESVNSTDAALCWLRPKKSNVCIDGYTLGLESTNQTFCGTLTDDWCKPINRFPDLPFTTPDILETELETCFTFNNLEPSSEYRATVKAHQNLATCKDGLGCIYNDPASKAGIYPAPGQNSISLEFETPAPEK